LGGEKDAHTVLEVLGPLADVLVAVREDHGSLSLFLAALKVTLVTSAIFELQPALSFKHILGKRAFIGFF